MRSLKKRFLAAVMAVSVVVTMLPFTAKAEENNNHVHSWYIDDMVINCILAHCENCDSQARIDVVPYGPEIDIISDTWDEAGLTISEIWYEGMNSTVYPKSKTKPKELGEYKVTVVAEGETLEVESTITDDCKDNNHKWNVADMSKNDLDSNAVFIFCENPKCSCSLMKAELDICASYEGLDIRLYGITGVQDYNAYFKDKSIDYSVTYEGVYPTVYAKSEVKPTKVGKYKVIFTIDGKIVEREFVITQDCQYGGHKWHGEVETEDSTDNTSDFKEIIMSCKNDYCSYNHYRRALIYVRKNNYNYIDIYYYSSEGESVPVEKAKLTYESISPVAGIITNELPTKVGDYKVKVEIEDVEVETNLKLTTTCGESQWRDPYGDVCYIEDKYEVLGLPKKEEGTLINVLDDYYEQLNVRNEGTNASTESKKQILNKLGDKEKAIFASMDLYACKLNCLDENEYYDNGLEYMRRYLDFSKMVTVENTKKDIEVYFNVHEFILGKEDFSDSNLKVLRNYKGNVEVLETEVHRGYFLGENEPNTDGMEKTRIYFKTDKFSDDATYALVYTETEEDTSCKCTSLTEVKGKEATCTEDGTKAYYKCAGCDKKYADKQGSKEIKEADLVVKAKGHSITKVEEKKATCTEEGTKEYYKCTVCDKKFEDVDGKKEIEEPVKIEKGHDMTFVQEKKVTCTEDGAKAHYTCSKCNKKYEDVDGKKELQDADIVIKSANGVHKEVIIPGYEATCCAPGLTDGKKCSECGDIIEAQRTIEKTEHVLLYVPGEPATYTRDGHRAYYECYMCRGMYADWYGTVKTNEKLIKINKLQVGVTKSIKAKTRKSSSITLSWSKVSGASGYAVFVAKKGKWVQLGATIGTSYTAKKLSAGTNYTYAVMAYKKVNGKAVWSNSYKKATLKTLPGKTSKISSKSAGKGKVTLSWNKVKGASGYRLYYKQGNKWVTLKSSMSGNSIKVTGLKGGKKYTFAVKAYVKESGKTVWSDVMTSKSVTAPKK